MVITEGQPTKRYAPRGPARETISLVVPSHVAAYLRKTAKRTGSSISLIATEMFEEAMFGVNKPTKTA